MDSKTRLTFKSVAMLALALPALVLADCTVGPDYKRPDVAVPAAFRAQIGASDATSIADLPWWSVFEDKALHDLIIVALHNNYDLQIAVARIKQAREDVAIAQSEAMPQLGYDVSGTAQEIPLPSEHSVSSTTVGTIGAVFNAAWEFDVWGRIRRTTEAAQANLLNREDIRRGVMLTLVSDLASGYFQLREYDRELAIARESVATFGKTLDLFRYRFEAGKDSELPVTRVRADYESANANIPTITRQIAEQENALSVLAGVSPGDIQRGRALTEQITPDTPLGLTTELLRRRPDILAAEQTMMAANAEIGVAVADFYPKIGLSALAGGEGIGVGSGIQGLGIWGVALSAAGPLFTGGRLEAVYRQRQAYWDETVAQYQKTILAAFQETSNAIVARQTLVKKRENLEGQIQALRRSLDIALLRYDAGRSGYFEVLDAEQQLYPAEYDLARTRLDQLVAVVNLYKALGGGWQLKPEQWAQQS